MTLNGLPPITSKSKVMQRSRTIGVSQAEFEYLKIFSSLKVSYMRDSHTDRHAFTNKISYI